VEGKQREVEGEGMITKEELRSYAGTSGLNLWQAEKDYFQNIVLFILYRRYGNEMVFKGGTALKKCYGLPRFSQDLDFTCARKMDPMKDIENGLRRLGAEFEKETEQHTDSLKIILRIRGPLFTGVRQSICKFIIDLSFRESVELAPAVKTIGRFMEEMPSFDVYVMQEREILAEKVRAVMSRGKARDVYDLRFLLEKGVPFDLELVRKKLEFYGEKWDIAKFRRGLLEKKPTWKTELSHLVSTVPDFEETRKSILSKVPGA
jgi:predicted nucleotidyltransferase component of viral defense system